MRPLLAVTAITAIAISSCSGNLSQLAGVPAPADSRATLAAAEEAALPELLASGEAKLLAGDYEGAIADLSAALKIDPKQASAYSQRGVALAKLADLDGALADYTRALELDPSLYTTHYNRGRIHLRRQDFHLAIEDFTAALAIEPEFGRALANRGFARAELEDYEVAIDDLQAASEIFLAEGDSEAYHRVKNAIRYMLP